MTILNFLALVLAVDAVVTAWFYGSIFEKALGYFERKSGFWGELMTCPLCLSYHVAFWLAVLFFVPSLLLPSPWSEIIATPLYALAATDLVHWLHGIRPVKEEEDDEGTSERNSDEYQTDLSAPD